MTPEKQFATLLRARTTLFWCQTGEERRVERALAAAIESCDYKPRFWDCATGATDSDGGTIDIGKPEGHPRMVYDAIRAREKRAWPADPNDPEAGTACREVWILRDLDPLLERDPAILRGLKSLARDLQDEGRATHFAAVVVLTSSPNVPESLQGLTTVIDWPLPTRAEISTILDKAIQVGSLQKVKAPKDDHERETIINAATGLAADDAAGAFTYSMVLHRKIDPATILDQKKLIISKTPTLDWIDPEPRGLDAIGGLGLLKERFRFWQRRLEPEALEYGLPTIRGLLIAGISGGGKSLASRCAATALSLPCVRLDLGAQRGSLVGETERNQRNSLKVIEAIAPVVVQIEEGDKAFGALGGTLDGGTSAGQLGTLLTFMQEHRGTVIFLMTCNDTSGLPAELFRRFDDTYFVDFPTRAERIEIFAVGLKKHGGRQVNGYDLDAIASATDTFTGAEIADKMIPGALEIAYADPAGRREPTTEDFLAAALKVIPLARSARERIDDLREWAKDRALPASHKETEAPVARPKGTGSGERSLVMDLPSE
jgi:hypothetical protein